MRLEQAFAQSINTAAVRVATTVGLDKVVAAARDLGIDAPLSPVPSLALGTSELTLIDLTGAFASVRAGRRIEPFGVIAFGPENQGLRTVGTPTGGPLSHREELTALLRRVVTSGTGRGADTGGFVAGKTGTSQDHRDAWFIGFNEALVVGVWVGNDDHSPMRGVTGGSVPAQIWRRFVQAAGAVVRARPHIAAEQMPESAAAPREAIATEGRGTAGYFFPFRAAPTPEEPQCDVKACAEAYDFIPSFRLHLPVLSRWAKSVRDHQGSEIRGAGSEQRLLQRGCVRAALPIVRRDRLQLSAIWRWAAPLLRRRPLRSPDGADRA